MVTYEKAGTPHSQSLVPAHTFKRLMPPSKTMITLLLPDFNPIPEKVQEIYNTNAASIQLHQLTCSCGHSACLSVHAYYHRNLKTPAGPVRMRIMRVICCECGRTHALLPSFIVPYSQIPATDQAEIAQFYEDGCDFSTVMDRCPWMDEGNIRSVIRNYLLYWKERLVSFALSFSDFPSLVSNCFRFHRLQFMQVRKTANVLFHKTT